MAFEVLEGGSRVLLKAGTLLTGSLRAQDPEMEAVEKNNEHPWQGKLWPTAAHGETQVHTVHTLQASETRTPLVCLPDEAPERKEQVPARPHMPRPARCLVTAPHWTPGVSPSFSLCVLSTITLALLSLPVSQLAF